MSNPPLSSPGPLDDRTDSLETNILSSGNLPSWIQDSPYWLIAVLFHVIALFIFSTIVILEKAAEEPDAPLLFQMHWKEKPYVELTHTTLEKTPPLDEPPSPHVTMTPKVSKKPKDIQKAKVPKPLSVIGTQGDFSPFSGAIEVGRLQGVPGGGNDAVRAALEWLKRHQHPDGRWSSHGFHENCRHEEGTLLCTFTGDLDSGTGTDAGFEGFDVGVTSLALLAFVGHGITHRVGGDPELRACVKRGLAWLLDQQIESPDPALDGLFGAPSETTEEWVYNHAIATLAIADLLLVSRDTIQLRRPTARAVEWCLSSRNPGYGWKYGYRTGKNDTSVTGWLMFALKSAKACGRARLIPFKKERYDDAFAGAISWIDAVTSESTAITGYEAPGDEGSRLQKIHGDRYPYSKELSCMTAVGVLTRVFAGESKRTDTMRRAVSHLVSNPPEWRPASGKRTSKINFYSWYYATYALYQIGGKPWQKWQDELAPTMVKNQRTDGCEHGSWDPIGEWGCAGGRVYSTAMGALILEVYHRSNRG